MPLLYTTWKRRGVSRRGVVSCALIAVTAVLGALAGCTAPETPPGDGPSREGGLAREGALPAGDAGALPGTREEDATLEVAVLPLPGGRSAAGGSEPDGGASPERAAREGADLEALRLLAEIGEETASGNAAELEGALAETARAASERSGPAAPASGTPQRPGSLEDVAARLSTILSERSPRAAAPAQASAAGGPASGSETVDAAAGDAKGAAEAALRGGAPETGGPPPPEAAQAETPGEPPSPEGAAEQPKGYVTFKTLFHKSAAEAIRFLQEVRPEWVAKGHVAQVEGKERSLVIFGETEEVGDPLTAKVIELLERFDQVGLEIVHKVIKPRYVDVRLAMDSLLMAGVANVWQLTPTNDALTWKEGDKQRTLSRQTVMYVEKGGGPGTAPVPSAPRIPFVYDLPKKDAVNLPPGFGGPVSDGSIIMSFGETSSTEERGGMMAVGTPEDVERILAFLETIDVPARRIMIEVQLIELDANKLQDFGIDAIQFGEGHTLSNLALPLPGEAIQQPGMGPDVRHEGEIVPEVVSEGLELLFDDTSVNLEGRFLATVHALVREGEAKVRARPKILTLDDRVSVLHLGREVPTFVSTAVTHDTVNGNIVSEVRQVGTVYAGITLHIRPRITGGNDDRVALQIEVVDNQVIGRQRVFAEDLAGIPEVIKRQYVGEAVAHNHRPIILGGLIQEQEVESSNKIPLLGDLPYLGYLFRRTSKMNKRSEVIIVVTPHILSEKGVDPSAMPKESAHFDTFDSVLFNDRHIIKGGDVLGLDPVNNLPAMGPDGKPFAEQDVLDLTLLNILKRRELVSKLKMLENYLGRDELDQLTWIQRRWPESTVQDWSESDKQLFFRVAAICIENIKELNPGLTFEDLTLPRREIVLPTSPYNLTLSYDRVKRVQSLGLEHVFRGGRVDLEPKHIDLIKKASGHSLRAFADFLERQERTDGQKGREGADHGILEQELRRMVRGLFPGREAIESVTYPDLYRELDKANVSFMSIATYLQANMEERYIVEGPPDLGAFPADLEAFLETTVSLKQRARRLKELEERWQLLNEET